MLAAGTNLGPYEILAPLGAGGMGEVYRARDARLGREVAVKVLPEHLADNAEALARFEREAKAVAALAHPNTLVLFDFGSDHGVRYAVTELLEGDTLRSRLAKGALPWRKALELGVALAEGLAATHGKGIIHRDLKPENVFLTTDGRVKILDFGLARVQPEASQLADTQSFGPNPTGQGIIMGTVGYMSPEQVRGQPVDARGDIFALGCVLYEMVTGQRAFARDNAADITSAILKDDPPELTGSGKKVPPEVERMIRHCLEKNPEERFQSARDLAFALRALSSDPAQELAGTGKQRGRPRRKGKAIDSLAILPFANASTDANAEFLSDGITESIINNLSRLPKLRVMARSTVFRYKGKQVTPQEAGQELQVRAVLTGRVLVLGNSLLIAVELVDAADGAQLWGAQVKRPLADLLAALEEIARDLTSQLQVVLSGEEKKRLGKRPTENSEAYQLYLQGRFHWNKRSHEGVAKGIEFFEAAIAKDPAFALAYAGLADSYFFQAWYGEIAPRTVMPKGKAAADQALAQGDTLAEPHAFMAMFLSEYDWDWVGAEREFKKALELNPGYATARHWYGLYFLRLCRFADADAELQRAQELDVLSLSIHSNRAFVWYCHGQFDRAIEHCRKTLGMDGHFWYAHLILGKAYGGKNLHDQAMASYQRAADLSGGPRSLSLLGHGHALAGRHPEARQVLAKLNELSSQSFLAPSFLALVHLGLGDRDQALASLDRACEEKDPNLVYLACDPVWDPLRSDGRFSALLRRLGLPDRHLGEDFSCGL